jgi:hypothetical protein
MSRCASRADSPPHAIDLVLKYFDRHFSPALLDTVIDLLAFHTKVCNLVHDELPRNRARQDSAPAAFPDPARHRSTPCWRVCMPGPRDGFTPSSPWRATSTTFAAISILKLLLRLPAGPRHHPRLPTHSPLLLTPLLPITSLQPLHFHALTHSFAQRRAAIPFASKSLRTLSIATGVYPHFVRSKSSKLPTFGRLHLPTIRPTA